MVKEKLWTLISQHEPSLVQINMVIFSVYIYFWYLFCDLLLPWQGTHFYFAFFFVLYVTTKRPQNYQVMTVFYVSSFLRCYSWNIPPGKCAA